MSLVLITLKISNGVNSFLGYKFGMIIKISQDMKSYAHIHIRFKEENIELFEEITLNRR